VKLQQRDGDRFCRRRSARKQFAKFTITGTVTHDSAKADLYMPSFLDIQSPCKSNNHTSTTFFEYSGCCIRISEAFVLMWLLSQHVVDSPQVSTMHQKWTRRGVQCPISTVHCVNYRTNAWVLLYCHSFNVTEAFVASQCMIALLHATSRLKLSQCRGHSHEAGRVNLEKVPFCAHYELRY